VNEFIRVLKYLRLEIKALVVSILCAFVVALLFTGSIGVMLPLMEVLTSENPHQDAQMSVVKRRFEMTVLVDAKDRLVVIDVSDGGIAAQGGILQGDIISGVALSGENVSGAQDDLLAFIAFDRIIDDLSMVTFEVIRADGTTARCQLSEVSPSWRGDIKHSLNKSGNALIEWGISFVPQSKDFVAKTLVYVVIFMLLITLLRCFLRFVQEYLVKRIGFRVIARIHEETFASAINLPIVFFSSEGSNDLISRFVQDTNMIIRAITVLLGKTIREPLKMFMALFVAFAINAKVTSVILVASPIVGIAIYYLGHKLKKVTKRILEERSRFLGRLQESLQGIREVKAYHREAFERDSFGAVNQKLLSKQYKMARLDAAASPIMEALGSVAACVGMLLGVKLLTGVDSEITASGFITIAALLISAGESGRKMGDVVTRIQVANAAARRVFEVIDQDGIEQDAADAVELPPLSNSIVFTDMTYTYPGNHTPALSNINLTVSQGQTVAVVGPNGCGKSTLLGMIARFYMPDKGTITFDGVDIATGTYASVRKQIGIVPQQTVLFNDTILKNIKYGRLDATNAEIIAAAKEAKAHEFIELTNDGYETMVGEQGANLSGGERQRLSIARVIVRNAEVLIFDEATSQIDADSAAKIQEAVRQFGESRTCFIIAHHLKSIVHCDMIVVMEAGEIIATGKHDELYASCPLYKKLYELN